jgi:hypothetical protein
MRIVLHIGLEKTGTTSIQAHCHRHAETLRAQGILYPAWLGYRNHADLVIAAAAYGSTVDMRTRAGVGSERELAAFRTAALGRLRQQVSKARPACLLLSDEHFSSRCGDAEVRRLKEMLAEFSDDVRVLVYLRRQDDLLVSLYSTFLKGQGTGGLARVAEMAKWFDFETVLARWSAAFGREALVVRLFPPRQGTLIDDFADAAGLPVLPADPSDARANRSLDQRNAALLARINELLPAFRDGAVNPDRVGLANFLEARSTGPALSMPLAERRAFLARFAESNEAVRAAFFPDLPELFDAPTDGQPVVADPTLDDAIALAVDIWTDRARLAAALESERRRRFRDRAARAVRRLRDLRPGYSPR